MFHQEVFPKELFKASGAFCFPGWANKISRHYNPLHICGPGVMSAVVSCSVRGVKGSAHFMRSWRQIELCSVVQLSFPAQTTFRDACGSDSCTAIRALYLSEVE